VFFSGHARSLLVDFAPPPPAAAATGSPFTAVAAALANLGAGEII